MKDQWFWYAFSLIYLLLISPYHRTKYLLQNICLHTMGRSLSYVLRICETSLIFTVYENKANAINYFNLLKVTVIFYWETLNHFKYHFLGMVITIAINWESVIKIFFDFVTLNWLNIQLVFNVCKEIGNHGLFRKRKKCFTFWFDYTEFRWFKQLYVCLHLFVHRIIIVLCFEQTIPSIFTKLSVRIIMCFENFTEFTLSTILLTHFQKCLSFND